MGLTDAQVSLLNAKGLGFLAVELEQQNTDTDAMWLIVMAVLVFFMQTGFAMLCAGLVRAKNTKNILLKNVLDACVGALGFWSVGYALAYGAEGGGNAFIGNTYFFLTNFEENETYHSWLFQFAFAATAATIVSGAVAERTKMAAYLCYSFFLTAFVYPVIVHWVWSSAGWLSAFNAAPLLGTGLMDFAGCGVVHMVGGISAGCGAYVCGPRLGRYDAEGNVIDIPGHSSTLQALGTFILWVGWYGFNPGSTLAVTGGLGAVAGKCAVTTTLSAAAGAVGCLIIYKATSHAFDLGQTLNGVLAGLVSITAGCSLVEPWAAVIIGLIGSIVYTSLSEVVKRKLKVDDVVDAFAVHCGCGMWGLIAASLFATKENHMAAYGVTDAPYGAFYAPTGQGHQMFVCALVGIAVIWAWVAGLMFPFFVIMMKIGWLRSPPEEEEAGMDISKHGGSAYPDYVVTSTVPVKSRGAIAGGL
mmetsp:Transcript_16517/g.42135  ORF Transcript_16517/g.42135 Transcript_16517/m.42135 type:complete len:472 (-) Transcript_16517:82-1497(-)